MINAIGNGTPQVQMPETAAKAQVEAKPVEAKPVEIHKSEAPTVEISLSAQAKLLKSQGSSISMIASQLGIDEKTVTQYVG
jgi:hypothetical protein